MSVHGDLFRQGRLLSYQWLLVLPIVIILAVAVEALPAAAADSQWVQAHRETELWSGPDARAVSFGLAPQWSYFMVIAPQGSRLHVWNPQTKNYAYVDAASVGPSTAPQTVSPTATPSSTPRPAKRGPQLATGNEEWWVANFLETKLWSGPEPEASPLWEVPQFRQFMVVAPQDGDRMKVWSPEKDWIGYLDVAVIGPSEPSIFMKMDIKPPKVLRQVELPGRAVGSKIVLRSLPMLQDEADIRPIPNNTAVMVHREVEASDGSRWFEVDFGDFLRADEVRLPPPPSSNFEGKWIDVDLEVPTIVTAYEGKKAVFSTLAIKGFAGTPTRPGTFSIFNRVANETMDSETIGIPRDAPGGYLLKNVLYTQYFTGDGASFHYNYWLGTFGWPGSHGCLGLSQEDSKWLWDWATIGTPVVIR